MQRPNAPEEQEDYDRGKKKRRTRKNLLSITETCHICFLSLTCEGKASDKTRAEEAGYTLPPGSCLYQDQGLQGCWLPEVQVIQPTKQPCGRELTPPEQEPNRRISSIRIEHAIGGVTRYRIVKDTIRLLKDGRRDTIMETCGGWHTFRLWYRPWCSAF